MKLENGEFKLIPDRVKMVKQIYKMALNGKGYVSIAKELNQEKTFF